MSLLGRILDRLGTVQSRVGPPRKLKVTREGWFYGLLTLGVGAAAINTGNNLLYLVLGLQLASIVISGVLSESVITGLELTSLGAGDARVGEPGAWLLRIGKRRGRVPSYSITLTAADGPARGASAGVLRLALGTTQTVELRFTPERRGRFVAKKITIATRFPFGLFEKSRELTAEQELFVYPRRGAAPLESNRPRPDDGPRRTHRAGRGPEPLSLRGWLPGDGLSRIHWLKSAQLGTWVAANREHEEAPAVELRVDLRAQPDPSDLARLEMELERAASGAEAAVSKGQRVLLLLGTQRVDGAADASGRRRLLRALAAAEPELPP
ncbi:MAG: DUF58 domain-containing protein [Deltaproteobacteria bacterium]|nr:DUF58 domain-containing protein [Deltaproteobacteria bacterium]